MVISRQVLLRLRGYISVCPTLQLSHNDVPGVGLGGCWNQVLPSHSRTQDSQPENTQEMSILERRGRGRAPDARGDDH